MPCSCLKTFRVYVKYNNKRKVHPKNISSVIIYLPSWWSEPYDFSSSMKQKRTVSRMLTLLLFPYNFIMSCQAPKDKKVLCMTQNVLYSKSPKAKQYLCVRKRLKCKLFTFFTVIKTKKGVLKTY